MLAKIYKLPLGDVRLASPKTHRYPHYTLKVGVSALSYARFGVVVSAKVYKTAVKRNKVKRRFFEVIRAHKLYMTPHRDIVIIVSPSVDKLGNNELPSVFLKDLQRVL